MKNTSCRGSFWGVALIYGAAVAAYLPAINGGLVIDDRDYVTPAPLRSLAGLGRIWFKVGATKQYYPVLHTAFWVEHGLWGDWPLAYHLLNVLMHATAACLFVLILRNLRVPGAYFAGMIFALHPVCVESVAWISEQKNTLSTVFYLLAALAYLHFDKSRDSPRKGGGSYILATALFGLALLSKSVTATLPAALLLVQWWRRGRLEWRRDVVPLLPWFVLGVAAGLFTSWVERNYVGAKGGDFTISFIARVLVAGRAVWFYLGKLFWPANLTFIYPRWKVSAEVAWQYLFPLGLLALLTALGCLIRRSRAPLAATLIFAGTLFPALGFLNVYFFIYSFVADHFLYLAAFSLIALTAAGWGWWAEAGGSLPKIAALATLCALGALTWRQSQIYRDSDTLYRSILTRNPGCWMAHNNRGVDLKSSGRLAEAETEYRAAITLKPDYAEAHNNLGEVWSGMPARLNDAIAQYEEALRLNPDYADAHNNLGEAWSRMPGRLNDAIAQCEAALRLNPDFAEAHYNLGNSLSQVPGRLPEAIAQYEAALRLNPDYAEARTNLGNAWSGLPGRLNDAIAQYEEVLRLEPDVAEAHFNLASAWARVPARLNDAIAQYEEALRLNPDLAEAHFNLALVLLKLPGRMDEARAQLEAFLRLQPTNVLARQILAEIQAYSAVSR